jgi:hypothetical protein
MWHSAEIRWFIPGPLPESVLHWFLAGQGVAPEPTRCDAYLLFPDCDTVGVKMREGTLEVKAVTAPSRPLRVAPAIHGRTDQWVKWSFTSEGLGALHTALYASGRWVHEGKRRYTRTFAAEADRLQEVPRQTRPGRGCHVELTCLDVHIAPRSRYSLGFEAFGPPATTAMTLDATLRAFFHIHGAMPGMPLHGRTSMSYPAWLATVA